MGFHQPRPGPAQRNRSNNGNLRRDVADACTNWHAQVGVEISEEGMESEFADRRCWTDGFAELELADRAGTSPI